LFYLLSEGPNHALRETLGIVDGGYPGWLLVEVDSNGEPTGRSIDDVYVGLRTGDPSGRQGRDIFEDSSCPPKVGVASLAASHPPRYAARARRA